MRPGVSRLLKLCVLGEFYARFSQDAQVNETLLLRAVLKIKSYDNFVTMPQHTITIS